MEEQDYNKKKKRKEIFKKTVINIFIWLIIISFVSTIGVYWGQKINFEAIKIATINKKDYYYQPGSLFTYILNRTRESLDNKLKTKIDYEILEKLVVNQAAQLLVTYGLIYDLANKIGITPSKEYLRAMLEYILRGSTSIAPSEGLLEYLKMEYANTAISGTYGDIVNCISPITVAELYTYFDLVNFTSVAEVVYLNLTNYFLNSLEKNEVNDYYFSNDNLFDDNYSYNENDFEMNLTYLIFTDLILKSSFEYQIKKYLNKYPDENNNYIERNDDKYLFLMHLSKNFNLFDKILEKLNIYLYYIYTNNNSNVKYYNYNNNIFGLGLTAAITF